MSSWEFAADNDKWATNTDQHYTHGTRFTRRSNHIPKWLRKTVNWLPCIACSDPDAIEYEFGQKIFTPADTYRTDLIEDDRPYAGWAYAKISQSAVRPTANPNRDVFDAIALQVGVVGPASLAERSQEFLHKRQKLAMPRGWDHQIQDEIGVVLTYTRGVRQRFGHRPGGAFGHDLAIYSVGSVGNVFTHLGVGVKLRSGAGLADEWDSGERRWHVFAEIEARAVARNIFLDGNTWSDSHSVRKRPAVGHVATGIAYEGPRFGLRITKVVRSKEFYGQAKPDEFATISFVFRP